jgi:hypothetical protein
MRDTLDDVVSRRDSLAGRLSLSVQTGNQSHDGSRLAGGRRAAGLAVRARGGAMPPWHRGSPPPRHSRNRAAQVPSFFEIPARDDEMSPPRPQYGSRRALGARLDAVQHGCSNPSNSHLPSEVEATVAGVAAGLVMLDVLAVRADRAVGVGRLSWPPLFLRATSDVRP